MGLDSMKYNDPNNRAIVGGVRYCGKTTALIKMAARFRGLIVCASPQRASLIEHQARDMGLFIKSPLSVSTLLSRPECLKGYTINILIDDVEDVLEAIFHQPVVIMSTSANLEPMKCLEEDNDDR